MTQNHSPEPQHRLSTKFRALFLSLLMALSLVAMVAAPGAVQPAAAEDDGDTFTITLEAEDGTTLAEIEVTDNDPLHQRGIGWVVNEDDGMGDGTRFDNARLDDGTEIDTFSDGDLSEYSGDETAFDVIEDTSRSGDHYLFGEQVDDDTVDRITSTPGDGLNHYPAPGDKFSFEIYFESVDDGDSGMDFAYDTDTDERYSLKLLPRNVDEIRFHRLNDEGNIEWEETEQAPISDHIGEWLTVTVELPDDGVDGQVVDQQGNPVEDATVYTTSYDTADPPQIEDRGLDEIMENPAPDAWDDQLERLGVSEPEGATDEDWEEYLDEKVDGWVVLSHHAEDWNVNHVRDVPLIEYDLGVDVDLSNPAVVYDTDDQVVLSIWEPTDRIFVDAVDSEIAGMETRSGEVTIERVDPLGNEQDSWSVDTEPAIEHWHANNIPQYGAGTKTHEVTYPVDLSAGVYEVRTEDDASPPTTIIVAEDGDPENLKADIRNWASEEEEARSEFNEEMKELYDEGNIEVVSDRTDENGQFSLDVGEQVDHTELVAISDAGALDIDPEDLSRSELRDEYQSVVESNFHEETGQELTEFTENNPREDFRQACREMDSVADETGTPFFGAESTSVPNNDVLIEGHRAIPPDVDGEVRECAAVNIVDGFLDEALDSVDSGLLNDIEGMTSAELEDAMDDLLALVRNSDVLEDEVEERTGIELESDDPADYTDEEIKQVLSDGYEIVDGGSENVPGTGGSTGGTSGAPTVGFGDTETSIDDEAEENFLNTEWAVGNVDDWEEAGLLIRLNWADGTTETITPDSEYVVVEQRTTRPDIVRLEDYPIGDTDPSSVAPRLDVSTDKGVGGNDGAPKMNPAADGEIPALDSIRVSTLTPGPDDRVSISANADDPTHDNLVDSEVTGPDGQDVEATVEDGDLEFTTVGAGTHRVEAIFENSEGERFTEVLRVRAGQTTQDRPPTVRASSGTTGRYAIVANGLSDGDLTVDRAGSEVELVGVIESGSDIGEVHASLSGLNLARDATIDVAVREGATREDVDGPVNMVIHTPPTDDDTLFYREENAMVQGEETPEGKIEQRSESVVTDTFSRGDEAAVELQRIENPTVIERTWHWIDLNTPSFSLPLLSALPGLPESVAVGGGPLAIGLGGAIVARKVRT